MLLSASVAAAIAAGQPKNPLHGNRDAIEAGKGMFRIYCSPCHGLGGEGGRAPDLTLGRYAAGDSDDALFGVIANGVAGTEMAGYSGRFDSDGIWRIIAYIRTVAGKPAPKLSGDHATGERLFWGKAACGGCHRVGTKGGRFGPELTAIGRMRSLEYLREALVEPGARLTPGYNKITVETRDGKKIVGIEKNYDAFFTTLMDSKENLQSFAASDVRSISREHSSLMPPTRLPEGDLNHLLVYLTSLRGDAR
jgi:putative heme-binding domain-containing protein